MAIGCTGVCYWGWDSVNGYHPNPLNMCVGCSGCGNPPSFTPVGMTSCTVPWPCSASSAKGKFTCVIYHHKDYPPKVVQHPGRTAKKKAVKRKPKKR
jgi:hypothetical protein